LGVRAAQKKGSCYFQCRTVVLFSGLIQDVKKHNCFLPIFLFTIVYKTTKKSNQETLLKQD